MLFLLFQLFNAIVALAAAPLRRAEVQAMMTALIVSQGISWVIIALLVALLALARQVGVLHMRVAPAGALTTAGGPSVGSKRRLDGAAISAAPAHALRLLMFARPRARCART
jgi:predicted NAD/FAD-binding protein